MFLCGASWFVCYVFVCLFLFAEVRRRSLIVCCMLSRFGSALCGCCALLSVSVCGCGLLCVIVRLLFGVLISVVVCVVCYCMLWFVLCCCL